MLELILEIIHSLSKHGLTWVALIGIITALYRHRRAILNILHSGKEQETQLDIIEHKLDVLLSKEGVTWDVGSKIGRNDANVTDGVRKILTLSQVGYVLAAFTASFTRVTEIFHLRGNKRMNKLLSRKLWMTVLGAVTLVLNQQLGWELNAESIIGIGSLFMSYILGQSVVDTNGVGQFAPLLEKLKSSKLWVTLIGSVVIVFNDQYQWGLTADDIYLFVGLAVSFILGKSAASVVQASKKSKVTEIEKSYHGE